MMAKYAHVLSLVLISKIFLSTAMDQPLALSVKKITAIPNACKVAFLKDGQLMVGYSNSDRSIHPHLKATQFIAKTNLNCIQNPEVTGNLSTYKPTPVTENNDGACIVNWQKNTKESELFTTNSIYPYCFRNQQRTAIALSNIFKVASYDPNGKKIWECDKDLSISTFSASNTLYAIQPDGTVHNNKNNTVFNLPSTEKHLMFPQTAAHHTKERLFFTCWLSILQSKLYTIDIENSKLAITWKVMPTLKNPSQIGDDPNPYHSPINDTIAFYYPFADQWCLYNPNNNEFIVENIHNGLCRLLTFHPQNPNLLGLLTKDGYGAIYDIKQRKIIMKTENSLGKTTPSNSFNYQMIDFSEDGKHLAVIAGNECFVLSNIDQLDSIQ